MKLKRYGVLLEHTTNRVLMCESDLGEYYKASEVDAYLESIGAGGATDSTDAARLIVDMLKEAKIKADKEAIDAHYEDAEYSIPAKAAAWQIGVLLAKAEKIIDSCANKTVDEHRAEFEEAVKRPYHVYWCHREQSYMSLGGLQALIYQSKWQGWLAAKGVGK